MYGTSTPYHSCSLLAPIFTQSSGTLASFVLGYFKSLFFCLLGFLLIFLVELFYWQLNWYGMCTQPITTPQLSYTFVTLSFSTASSRANPQRSRKIKPTFLKILVYTLFIHTQSWLSRSLFLLSLSLSSRYIMFETFGTCFV